MRAAAQSEQEHVEYVGRFEEDESESFSEKTACRGVVVGRELDQELHT